MFTKWVDRKGKVLFYGKSEEKIKKKIFNVLPETIFLKMFQLKQIIIKLFDERHLSKMIDKCFTMVLLTLPEKYLDSFGRASYIK